MIIIEKQLIGKKVDQTLCEDGIFISEDFIAVIDGVTSKGNLLWDGKKSGVYAKNLIMDYLKSIPFDASCMEVLNGINRLFYKECEKRKIIDSIYEYLRASVIIYSRYYKEIWSYGDCQCIINNQYYLHKKMIDETIANLRAFFINSYLNDNQSTVDNNDLNQLSREAIKPFLERQLFLENTNCEFSYGVLNGQQINQRFLKCYFVEDGSEVILASDGYPKLFNSLIESEQYLKKSLMKIHFAINYSNQQKVLIKEN